MMVRVSFHLRQFPSLFGTSAGGDNAKTEAWNGTAWSEVNDMPTSHFALASATNSPQTSGIVFGGTNPTNNGVSAESDSYDGTNRRRNRKHGRRRSCN